MMNLYLTLVYVKYYIRGFLQRMEMFLTLFVVVRFVV